MNLALIAGTRPNFIKISPLIREIQKHQELEYTLVHTGQHYDKDLSEIFFKQLKIPKPNINLGITGGNREEYIQILTKELIEYFQTKTPDIVIVVGDVNSTLGAALAANDLKIPVAHIEAGLRSFDMTMPEEINRIEIDKISTYLFTTEQEAINNLESEMISKSKIIPVGNIMIDTLLSNMIEIDRSNILETLHLQKKRYILATIHRQSNVDNKETLVKVLDMFTSLSKKYKFILPLHPRTKLALEKFNLENILKDNKNIILTNPLGYFEFVKLIKESICVISDSGGVQEETTMLNIPCITMRENTERPITISRGTSILAGDDYDLIPGYISKILNNQWKKNKEIDMWDGKTAERIVRFLLTEHHIPTTSSIC